MTSDRIDEILKQTAYPESASNRSALLQVWNECGHYYKSEINALQATIEAQEIIIKDKSKHIEQIESYTDISYIKAGVFNSKPKVQP